MTDNKGKPVSNIKVQSGLTHFVYTDENGINYLKGLISGRRELVVRDESGKVVAKKDIELSKNMRSVNFACRFSRKELRLIILTVALITFCCFLEKSSNFSDGEKEYDEKNMQSP